MKTTTSSFGIALAAFCIGIAGPALHAQTYWTGGGANTLWSQSANWSNGIPTSSLAVDFGGAAEPSTPSALSSEVSASISTGALTFANNLNETETDWAVQIDSGATLTATKSVIIGGQVSTTTTGSFTTQVTLTGGGEFYLNASSTAFSIGNSNSNNSATVSSYATLDASGLAVFDATVSSITVGNGQASVGTLYLGQTSNLITNTLTIGAGGTVPPISHTPSALYLGANTTLQANTITVGNNTESGTLTFQTGLSAPTVTIEGKGGAGTRADVVVGNAGTQDFTTPMVSTLDLTGGTVNALIGNLTIGTAARGGQYIGGAGGGVTASVSMDAGTMNATSVIIGQSTNTATTNPATSAAALASGTLTVNGGTFTAGSMILGQSAGQAAQGILNIGGTGSVVNTGNIMMASQASPTSTAAATAQINLSGTGSLSVGGNIAGGSVVGPGSATSTINFNGGTLQAASANTNASDFVDSSVTTNIGAGGATIDPNGQAITYNGAINHSGSGTDGGLTVGVASAPTGGNLAIASTNTFNGATTVLANNTLTLTGTNSLQNSPLNVGGGGTFVFQATGAYLIGGLENTSGGTSGTLNFGANTVGINTGTGSAGASSVMIAGGSAYQSAAAIIISSGGLTLGGTLAVDFTTTLAAGSYTFNLLSNNGGSTGITGSFSNVSIVGSYIASGNNSASDGNGDTFTLINNDTQLSVNIISAIPEPATDAVLLGAVMFGFTVYRRRRA